MAITGTDDLVKAGQSYGNELESEAKRIDGETTAKMLGLMRSRVRKDSGTLLNSIKATVAGNRTTVEASEPKAGRRGDVDIARTTEFGRGQRVVADANWHGNESGRPRKRPQRRGEGAQQPAPFFRNSAAEALSDRAKAMDGASDRAGQKTGWL